MLGPAAPSASTPMVRCADCIAARSPPASCPCTRLILSSMVAICASTGSTALVSIDSCAIRCSYCIACASSLRSSSSSAVNCCS